MYSSSTQDVKSIERIKNCKSCIIAKSTNTVLTGSTDDPPTLKQLTFCMDITLLNLTIPIGVITHQASNSTLVKVTDLKSDIFIFFIDALFSIRNSV
jgi:hypothetical protein